MTQVFQDAPPDHLLHGASRMMTNNEANVSRGDQHVTQGWAQAVANGATVMRVSEKPLLQKYERDSQHLFAPVTIQGKHEDGCLVTL
jgi:hypothetical protein